METKTQKWNNNKINTLIVLEAALSEYHWHVVLGCSVYHHPAHSEQDITCYYSIADSALNVTILTHNKCPELVS